MIRPTIHLNGSSPDTLYDGYREAGDTIYKALEALRATAPNARDYYPQGPDAYRQATKEHEARCAALASVLESLGELAEHCLDEMDKRKR